MQQPSELASQMDSCKLRAFASLCNASLGQINRQPRRKFTLPTMCLYCSRPPRLRRAHPRRSYSDDLSQRCQPCLKDSWPGALALALVNIAQPQAGQLGSSPPAAAGHADFFGSYHNVVVSKSMFVLPAGKQTW